MSERFDIAVIGGGVVGLAILRRFAMAGLKCVLLEKGADILSGASKANSALLHTGFDAPAKSLELQCMKAGYAEYLDIRQKLNLPLLETGAVVTAWTQDDLAALDGIIAKAHANGVLDVKRLTQTELRMREHQLSKDALGGVLVTGEHVIDAWSAPLAYAQQAIAHGAVILRNAEVTKAEWANSEWRIANRAGDATARVVINAAGLFGDHVEALARPSPFTIKPRKGQFVVFDKPAAKLLRSIILPVPNERTKGVVLFRTIYGNLAIGPTAEETDERENPSTDTTTLENLKARAIEMLPPLKDVQVTAVYARHRTERLHH
jgi:glycerol-3-phosphate dehydrogenase